MAALVVGMRVHNMCSTFFSLRPFAGEREVVVIWDWNIGGGIWVCLDTIVFSLDEGF